MARLLLLRAEESDGRWVGVRSWLNDPAIGSILLVAKSGNREIEGDVVRGICDLIQDIVVPLMTEERALRSGGRKEIVDAVREEGKRRSLFNAREAEELSRRYGDEL